MGSAARPRAPAQASLPACLPAYPAFRAHWFALWERESSGACGEIVPFVNRTFEWGVPIATFLSVLCLAIVLV